MERPAIPVATARVTLAATCSGSTAYPPSKSAVTGTSTAPAMSRRCASASSRVTFVSGRPNVQARPALVVARAGKPSWASARATPTSHGLAITKQPERCRR